MMALPGQMSLDLYPAPPPESAEAACIRWLVEAGCDEGAVAPMVARLYERFGRDARDRAKALAHFYGKRRIPGSPEAFGVFDPATDYHVVWDRCWAARWVGAEEAANVMRWNYNYRKPYTGAPVYIWYIDNRGREVKRPYEEET